MNVHRTTVVVARVAGFLLLAAVVAACGSSLPGAEWLWCKEHLSAVDTAADSLQIPKPKTTYQEPSWWPDYVNSTLSRNNAALTANANFTASCNVAADAAGLGESRVNWCSTDGLGEVWDASITLGAMVDMTAETFAYKALPLQKRIDNADFVNACRSAYAAATS